MTVDRILKEHDLAEIIRNAVGQPKPNASASALKTLRDIHAQISSNPNHSGMLWPEAAPCLKPAPERPGFLASFPRLLARGLWTFTWPYVFAVLIAVAWTWYATGPFPDLGSILKLLTAAVLALAAALALLYWRFRVKEWADKPDDSAPDDSVLSSVQSIENAGVVNHLAGVSVMKPGLLRKLTLKLAFWLIAERAAQSRPGFLGDLGTIHAARWVLLPGTNKLLFFSNYSGSWESYLEDFITKAAHGLTAVWSNTHGFPRTTNLFREGAADGDRFKRWARCQQIPSYFWYRAYPDLTAHTIRLNAAIRRGLALATTEAEAAQWLTLFGSRVGGPRSIEAHEVQSILFGGMRRLRDATCYLLRLPNTPMSACRWLKAIAPQITFGERPPSGSAQIVAFTRSGLEKFGCPTVLSEFPLAFRQGMSDPLRAERVLRETGQNSPTKWDWGNDAKPTDAALIVYAAPNAGASAVQSVSAAPLSLLTSAGGSVVAQVDTTRLPSHGPVREAFGFVDGISQPIIRGTPRWLADKNPLHVVEPGEFILGYPDNRGYVPPTLTVASSSDPYGLLPAADSSGVVKHDWPSFLWTDTSTVSPRDIGRNGSFLVIRQIEQFVELFNQCIDALARKVMAHPYGPRHLTHGDVVVWLKSKAVGRWPDGDPLVRYPQQPRTGPQLNIPLDNSFLPGLEDPSGLNCPFGAHIRRANPRDSFDPGSADQLAIANRHRILRVGRPYGTDRSDGTGSSQGLLFMCLNGDMERQFEFIQQTWLMSRNFHGLTGEVDAIVGNGSLGQLTIPTPQGPVVVRGFQDFVRVRGGAYFFVPSRSAIRYLHTH